MENQATSANIVDKEQLTLDELKILVGLVGNMTVSVKDAPAAIALHNKLARLIDHNAIIAN